MKSGKGRKKNHQPDYEEDDARDTTLNSVTDAPNLLQMTAELVPCFDGRDKTYPVQQWINDVEDNAEIFGWSPLQQLLVARRSLTGTAGLWLKAERPYKSWDDLKGAVAREFPDTVDVKTVHELMTSRKKRQTESSIDYMLVMKELGKRGKMPDYVAIKYIVDGISDVETNKVMLYGVTSYNELKEKLKIYDVIKSKMSATRSTERQQKVRQIRCYNCGELGHASSECPHKTKGLKCFQCNEFGHVGSACKGKVNFGDNREQSGASGVKFGRQKQFRQPNSVPKRTMFGSIEEDQLAPELTTNETQLSCMNCQSQETSPSDSDSEIIVMTMEGSTCVCEKRSASKIQKPIKCIKIHWLRCDDKMYGVELDCDALLDTGSDISIVSTDVYRRIDAAARAPALCKDGLRLRGIGSMQVIPLGWCSLDISVDGKRFEKVKFYVVESKNIPYEVVLGQTFLNLVTIVIKGGSIRLRDDEWLYHEYEACFAESVVDCMEDKVLQREVASLVETYEPNQTMEAPLEMKIILKDDIPVSQGPRRLSLKEQEYVEKQVLEWMEKKIVRVSFSDYSSPIVLVKKKDLSVRVCVDYRQLNKKIVKDEFPLPVIEDLIDKLKDAKYFSVLDLKNGFFHLRISEESIKYTSFVTHHGQFEFLRAPFGLSICPKYFMRYITAIFRELLMKGEIMIFIDDLLVPASSEVEAVERLKKVLQIASKYGLEINWKKAKLVCKEIEYLGHLIKGGEVRPTSEKIDAVLRYPKPLSIKQVHSFLGLTSYFRKYIENFATIAKPLSDLLRKEAQFEFGDRQKIAFETLKSKLSNDPVLKIYNSNLPTEMHTDASAIAYSAILLQLHHDGLHPVYYMSKKTSEVESKYSSYELEAMAIIEGVKKFRPYLYGIHFKIVTDCQAFEQTLRKKELSAKVARWVLFLDEFDFEVEHRVGSKMRHTDALSRYPYVAIITNSLHDQIHRAQQNDVGVKAICEILKSKTYLDYWMENGLLYKGDTKQLVIPRALEKEIIRKVHSTGHFSIKKMRDIITKDYYISGLDKKLQDFMLGCIPCLLASRKAGKQEGFLNPIEKESMPLQTLHLDHIGPLTATKKQYNYILTVVDAFTKFTWIFPTKSTTTKETLDKMRILQQHFGNPARIITDKGTAFTSGEFQEYCKEENIDHVTITTGVPRGNGQVERVHRTIIAILTKMCIETPALWYRHVSCLQRALNSTYHRSIATSPFQLMIGAPMRTKEDIGMMELLKQEEIQNYDEDREEKRIQAKQQILKVQEENKKTYNKSRKESYKYEVGDMVAIKRTQFGAGLKLKPKYLGPYEVVKVKRNDRYEVQKADDRVEGAHRTSTVADQMKKWPVEREEE